MFRAGVSGQKRSVKQGVRETLHESAEGRGEKVARRHWIACLALAILVLSILPTIAFGGTSATAPKVDDLQAAIAASEESVQLTDPQAAEELPHGDLIRSQVLDLLEGVFEAPLLSPVGPFDDDLSVRRVVSDYAAVLNAPTGEAGSAGESAVTSPEADGDSTEPTLTEPVLLESTIPLATEAGDGTTEVLNLSLEQADGVLRPDAPLIPVEFPEDLGDGIQIPGVGIGITPVGTPSDRSPSILDDSVAVYPNVADDTDFSVSPAPQGLETFTTLRTPQAPRSQLFELDIPAEASLREDGNGGAEIVRDTDALLRIEEPTAIDANGDSVPVTLEVTSTSSFQLRVAPGPATAWPVLVDPLFDAFPGLGTYSAGWNATKSTSMFGTGWVQGSGFDDLFLTASAGPYKAGDYANWFYYVPRLAQEEALGRLPTSYIVRMDLGGIRFATSSAPTPGPSLVSGIWDQSKGKWAGVPGGEAVWVYPGNGPAIGGSGGTLAIENGKPGERDELAQHGLGLALQNTVATSLGSTRATYLRSATVQIGDSDAPTVANASVSNTWMNSVAAGPITVDAADLGLGVRDVKFSLPSWSGNRLNGSAFVHYPCIGTAANPCPAQWSASLPASQYDPSQLPQGFFPVGITAYDAIGNATPVAATANAVVKVDHSTPSLALAGNLTEQTSVGTKLSQYTLKIDATDGDDVAASASAPFGTAGSGVGQIQRPMGIARDPSGNLLVLDRERNKVVKFGPTGNFLSEFGVAGSGAGQLNDPRGFAVAANGNVWIAEYGNKRVEGFTSSGEFIQKLTIPEINHQTPLKEPYAVATGPGQTVWVSDTGNQHVYKFKEDGTYIGKVKSGTSLKAPQGLATDSSGDVWVTDNNLNQILEYDGATLELKHQFAGPGSGPGQLKLPMGLAVANSGNLLVIDAENNRVQVLTPDGRYLRHFGSVGAGQGQLSEPRAIVLGPGNTAFIADAGNKRIARWSHVDQDPQSGVTKTEVMLDGTLVEPAYSPGCATKNCSISREWLLKADQYGAGQHNVSVIATDGVGLASTKSLTVELHGDLKAPNVALSGTMTQQGTLGTTRPNYTLKAVATDPGSTEEWQSGVATTTIRVDGKAVDTFNPGCSEGGCSITREWTLKSDSYPVGSHLVEVVATDAAGRTTTSPLTLNIERDTTAPTIVAPNNFYTATRGWLEQKSYNVNAQGADVNGYGVTSMVLKIDGTIVKSVSQSCPQGGCSKALGVSAAINMAAYAGGDHPAELLVTDGAGNWRKREWTINVDPSGTIPASEATDTLQAVEDTTTEEEWKYDPTPGIVTWGERISEIEPTLEASSPGELSSEAAVPVTVGTDVEDGFTVEAAGQSEAGIELNGQIDVAPVGTASNAGSATLTDEDVAAVFTNTATSTDTVVRPVYDGLMNFASIRDALSPETFSWEVTLQPGQEMKPLDAKNVGVFFEGIQMMLITAQGARAADGKVVDTTLSTSGKIVSLTVQHRVAGVMYPVTAGAGFRAGYSTVVFTPPPEEGDLPWGYSVAVSPPEPAGTGDTEDASASSVPKYIKTWRVSPCNDAVVGLFACEAWKQNMRGFFYFNYFYAWHPGDREPSCWNSTAPAYSIDQVKCDWVGSNHQRWNPQHPEGGNYPLPNQPKFHITAQTTFYAGVSWAVAEKRFYKAVTVAGEGDGTVYAWINDSVCNPWTHACSGDVGWP